MWKLIDYEGYREWCLNQRHYAGMVIARGLNALSALLIAFPVQQIQIPRAAFIQSSGGSRGTPGGGRTNLSLSLFQVAMPPHDCTVQ